MPDGAGHPAATFDHGRSPTERSLPRCGHLAQVHSDGAFSSPERTNHRRGCADQGVILTTPVHDDRPRTRPILAPWPPQQLVDSSVTGRTQKGPAYCRARSSFPTAIEVVTSPKECADALVDDG